MMGWRGRIGFLVPPGNPTVEPEMAQLVPKGVSLHFTRMVAHGETGTHAGQEDRNRTQIEHLPENVALLAMVKPDVIVMAHTATSYTLGKAGEAELVARMEKMHGIPFITAFGSVLAALAHLRVERVAYAQEAQPLTAQAVALLQGDKPVIAPIFSPRTAEILAAECRRITATAPLIVIAMSPAVAEAARDFAATVIVAAHPDADSMGAALRAQLVAGQGA